MSEPIPPPRVVTSKEYLSAVGGRSSDLNKSDIVFDVKVTRLDSNSTGLHRIRIPNGVFWANTQYKVAQCLVAAIEWIRNSVAFRDLKADGQLDDGYLSCISFRFVCEN